MANLQGFWSYVHADDEAERGRISQLARDVVDQFEMLTGEKITLFLDKDAIEWGENWRNKIEDSLESVGFFVPVLTPRYFMSMECRRELQFYARNATDLGIKDLILPLLYVNIPSFDEQPLTDDLMRLVQTFQREDWRSLRFLDRDSEGYRKGVFQMANRLVQANKRAEESITISSAIDGSPHEEAADVIDEPGIIDLLVETEEKIEMTPTTLNAIAADITLIGDIAREATADMQKPSSLKSVFAYRQMISRRTANQMSEPIERIWSLSNEFSSQIHSVDKGYRIIIEKAPSEIQENPESKTGFCTFFNAVRGMVTASVDSFASFQKMIEATYTLDKMSRDLRPAMRRLRQGLNIMIESKSLFQEWIILIESTGVLCDDIVAS